eukprot:TRINITY_DN23925_c0_g1_i3.p1 TRINITY_DN23925_c0_g1~~TRINITY_DN23925_c0_g1_i3.p1  ORF type:complete len:141 (+),score=50.88 TRINITY_DN23925_c0_g1_i3:216-638(+)
MEYSAGDVEDNKLIEDLEHRINRPLNDDERVFLLTGEQVDVAIRADELELQKKRLNDLQNLFGLIKDLNSSVHDSDEKMKETQKKVETATEDYIATGTSSLAGARDHMDAIRRKKRISIGVGILVLIAVVVVIIVLVVKK